MINICVETAEKGGSLFPEYREKRYSEESRFSLPTGGRITPRWQLSLDALIDGLERLPAMTELRFLKVGSMLQEISARLLIIGQGADKAARLMSGEEAQSVVRDMELLLDRLEDDFIAADRTAGQVGNLLGGILGELSNMDRQLESFKGHVGNLRMLKLLTNIQVASLRERGVGFRNVAADIGALSQNIHVKSNAILSRVKNLNADLVKGKTMVAGLGVTQKQLNRTMVSAVRSKIAIMAEMHANCSIAARDISSRSGDISRDVGSIVVALQFQDITRQQMEHACEALVGVQNRIATDGMLSAELAGICALQSAQLTNSADELVTAVTAIDSSLQAVAKEASGSSARVHVLFRQAEGVGRSSLADIELSLGSLSGAFAENVTARESLADIIQATTAAMGEITGFAEEIDFLGSEIRLIALNAIIKAAQAGREGAAFSVIAENIKQQSDDICRQAATINSSIETITRHVIDLHHEMHGEGDRTTSLRTEELATTVARLRGLIDEAGELLLSTDKAADSVADIIAKTTAALSSRELIAILQNDLHPRVERLAAGLGLHDSRSDGVLGAELRYTMGSERAIHQRFLDKADSGRWNGEPGKGFFRSPPAGENHFDSNVEFF
jgi:methyl-accepting chemotaxis protein